MTEIKITILSKEDCHFCDLAKTTFNKLKEEFNLKIEIIDSNTENGQDILEKYHFLFFPGILINNQPFCYGRPSERKIRKELKRLSQINIKNK